MTTTPKIKQAKEINNKRLHAETRRGKIEAKIARANPKVTPYRPTIAFGRFRAQSTDLSRLYWFHYLNSEIAEKLAPNLEQDKHFAPQVSMTIGTAMFSITTAEYISISSEILGRTRLQILLLCSGALETYLKDIGFAYLSATGYREKPDRLDSIGSAIFKALIKDSIPVTLENLEKLCKLSLGQPRKDWNGFYKLRCIAAHSGGVATPRAFKDYPTLSANLNEHVTITWDQLHKAMKAADDIASAIDQKLQGKDIKLAEILLELKLLKDAKKLPKESDVWAFLHKQFGLVHIKQFKNQVVSEIYSQ